MSRAHRGIKLPVVTESDRTTATAIWPDHHPTDLRTHRTTGESKQQGQDDLGSVPKRRFRHGPQGEETSQESDQSRMHPRVAAVPGSVDTDQAGDVSIAAGGDT